MNKVSTLRGALAVSLLAVTGLVAAADNAPAANAPAGKHVPHQRYDPVKHAQHKLDRLEEKLNLKDAQKTAWQAYADAILARAKERSARMQEFDAKRGAPKQDIDTAGRLDKAAERMHARADELQKLAQETRALQESLSPEQKAILDLYWESRHRRGRMAGHRPA